SATSCRTKARTTSPTASSLAEGRPLSLYGKLESERQNRNSKVKRGHLAYTRQVTARQNGNAGETPLTGNSRRKVLGGKHACQRLGSRFFSLLVFLLCFRANSLVLAQDSPPPGSCTLSTTDSALKLGKRATNDYTALSSAQPTTITAARASSDQL